jgi:NNP family nitrate/nitrite transporter-like MFS transporter
MKVSSLFRVKDSEIKALHLTWIAFFITFYVWFNMAPLATTIIKEVGWLTKKELKLFAICNVALTIPARLIVGMLLDKYGPRRVFSVLMVVMAIPTFFFAFGNTFAQMIISRLVLGSVGAGFVVGIHMTALWFKPRDIGFAEGFWRYAIAFSGALMLVYGIFYWFAITDGPKGKPQHKPRKVASMEVSTWGDLIKLILFIIPCVGILSILVWRINTMGYIGTGGATIAYLAIASFVLYQIIQAFRVNAPILKKGVPEDDKYNFNQVASLNTTYFCNFGAELAVVSMLPAFFEGIFSLTPAKAGLIAASFAFVNLVARPLGGVLSDSMKSRKLIMLVYMLGIALGFFGMGFIDSDWPIFIAVILTIACSMFVQGAEGATFAIIPMVKRRITGQISGMAGSYGNVGAVFYLTVLTMVEPNTFFLIIGGGALFSFLFCALFLKEPQGAFGEEYHMSSVDHEIMEESAHGH